MACFLIMVQHMFVDKTTAHHIFANQAEPVFRRVMTSAWTNACKKTVICNYLEKCSERDKKIGIFMDVFNTHQIAQLCLDYIRAYGVI